MSESGDSPSYERIDRRWRDPTHSGIVTAVERPSASGRRRRATIVLQSSGRRRGTGWLVLSAVVLAGLIIVGAALVTRGQRSATIYVQTSPVDAQVALDGWPVEGQSPFIITRVPPRERHILSVRHPGYRSWHSEIALEPGHQLHLPLVQLQLEPETAVVSRP